jgi:hypothetical protein
MKTKTVLLHQHFVYNKSLVADQGDASPNFGENKTLDHIWDLWTSISAATHPAPAAYDGEVLEASCVVTSCYGSFMSDSKR